MPKMPVRKGSPPSGLAILGAPPLGRIWWTAERDQQVTAGGPVDLHPDRAVVDVEERAVRPEGVEPQVVLRQWLDDLVDVCLALVHPLGERPEVLDHALH